MATQSLDNLSSHLLKHYTLLENFKAECKICKKIYAIHWQHLKAHLIHHMTIDKMYKGKVVTKRSWTWQYYNTEGHVTKCNICGKSVNVISNRNILLCHLKAKHPEKVPKKIRHVSRPDKITHMSKNENLHNWIWQYCKIEDNKARCTICGQYYNVFWGMAHLRKHLIEIHQISAYLRTGENTEENEIDRATKQLVTKEDVADTSFRQTILHFKTHEKNEEEKWRLLYSTSSTNSSNSDFGRQILNVEGNKIYTVL